jgi:hypothetical protein
VHWESLEAAEQAQDPFFASVHTERLRTAIDRTRSAVVLAGEVISSARLALR